MATAVIRNLINSQIDKQLYKVKGELRNQGTKQIQKVKEKLPNKEELKEKLISNSCERKAQDKMTKIYDKLIKLIDNLLKIPTKGLEKLKNIDKKLKKIRDVIIPKIQAVLDFLNKVVVPALLIVVIAAEVALAASSGPVANGKVIDAMSEKKKLILGKVKEYAKLGITIIAALNPIIFMIEKLFSIMEVAIMAVKTLIAIIKKLKDFIIFLFRNYIKKCNVANQTPISNDGSVNADLLEAQIQAAIDKAATGTLSNNDSKNISDKMSILYNDLLEDLKENGKTKIIERLIRTKDDIKTSYEVITVPLP
tara:strand:+ start:288 stop:1214 length:927 start_codon:yes stop_codon:yes gene_type:complete